jgi:hypothetical protein
MPRGRIAGCITGGGLGTPSAATITAAGSAGTPTRAATSPATSFVFRVEGITQQVDAVGWADARRALSLC